MRPAENIKRLIEMLSDKTSAQMDQRVREDMLRALEDSEKPTALSWPRIGRTIMRSPLTKLAIAASVIIACVIGLSLWTGTQSGIALADVLARVEKVNAYQSQWDYSQTQRAIVLISSEYGRKVTNEVFDPNGGWRKAGESYLSPHKKTFISISHKNKKYTREEFGDDFLERQLEMPSLGLLSNRGPRDLVKSFLDYKHESTGRTTIDGIEVEGFRITDPNLLGIQNVPGIRLWVDVKTLLPVRWQKDSIQEDSTSNEARPSDVMRFRWDVPISPAEFEPVIPDDYTGTVVKWPSFNEEIAIQGLKLWVELLGNYPAGFAHMILMRDFKPVRAAVENSQTPAAMRLKEELKGLTEDEKAKKLRVALLPMQCLTRFRVRLLWDKKYPRYYGKAVTPKDADKVLWRWKLSDTDLSAGAEYRVIFGDLHAETVSSDKLAQLEAALPKVDAAEFEGGFESGVLYPWRTYGNVTARLVTELAGATVPEDVIEGKYCLFLDVAPGIANFWDAGLGYSVMVFQKGKKYTLSAFLKSKKGDLQVSFKPGLATDPWTGYGEEMMTITEKWAEYSVTTPVFEADIRPATLTFHIGSAVGGFWVDGVRFYEGDYVPPAARQ